MEFSDYVVYADESGDHSLTSINPQNPTFVLVFCIFEKAAYVDIVVPVVQRFKFEFFGHDCIVLHGHEIRKARGEFNILLNAELRERFMTRLKGVIEQVPVTVIASVIDKQRHVLRYSDPANPYAIALAFCMERLRCWIAEKGQSERLTHLMVEKRGAAEDAKLELEFRRLVVAQTKVGAIQNIDIRLMDKKHNSTGLQVADLFAHPIGRHVINPLQPNRAFELLEPKFRRSAAGVVKGYGLKIFP